MPAIEGMPEGVEIIGVTSEVRGDVEYVWDHGVKLRRGCNVNRGALAVKPADGYMFAYDAVTDQVKIVVAFSAPKSLTIRVNVESADEEAEIRGAVERWNKALGGRVKVEG